MTASCKKLLIAHQCGAMWGPSPMKSVNVRATLACFAVHAHFITDGAGTQFQCPLYELLITLQANQNPDVRSNHPSHMPSVVRLVPGINCHKSTFLQFGQAMDQPSIYSVKGLRQCSVIVEGN